MAPYGSSPFIPSSFLIIFPILRYVLLSPSPSLPAVSRIQALSLIWLQCHGSFANDKETEKEAAGALLCAMGKEKVMEKSVRLVLMGVAERVDVRSLKWILLALRSSSDLVRSSALLSLQRTPLFHGPWGDERENDAHQEILSALFLARCDEKNGNSKTADSIFNLIGLPTFTWQSTRTFLFPLLSHTSLYTQTMTGKAIALAAEMNKIEMRTVAMELIDIWRSHLPPKEKEEWEMFDESARPSLSAADKLKYSYTRRGVATALSALIRLIQNKIDDSNFLLDFLFKEKALLDDEVFV